MAKTKNKLAFTLPVLGLVCLLGLCFEYVIILFEQFIYNKNYYKFTITESITHWLITSVLWGMLGLVLFYVTARIYKFNLLKKEKLPQKRDIFTEIFLLIVAFAVKLLVYGGWKPIIDFKQSGWFQFIFQYIYYLFEAGILLMMIIFVQESAERFLRAKKIKLTSLPWGGIVLSLTWGIIHTVTEVSLPIALCITMLSLFFGIAHIAANKNFYISYAMILILYLV